jgi:flavin reductase (DIM6/NTAB) family NADH-FMN oxidoreductase RutF
LSVLDSDLIAEMEEFLATFKPGRSKIEETFVTSSTTGSQDAGLELQDPSEEQDGP